MPERVQALVFNACRAHKDAGKRPRGPVAAAGVQVIRHGGAAGRVIGRLERLAAEKIMLADDDIQPAILEEGPGREEALVLQAQQLSFVLLQGKDNILIRPGIAEAPGQFLAEQLDLRHGKHTFKRPVRGKKTVIGDLQGQQGQFQFFPVQGDGMIIGAELGGIPRGVFNIAIDARFPDHGLVALAGAEEFQRQHGAGAEKQAEKKQVGRRSSKNLFHRGFSAFGGSD